jgi:hypothetical protein
LAAVLVLLVALGGCGSKSRSHAATTSTTTAAGTARPRAGTFIRIPADAIVSMRRFSPKSLMWQTVFVRPDGTGNYVYSLHTGHEPVEGFGGRVPLRLMPLVNYLAGLMFRYCC